MSTLDGWRRDSHPRHPWYKERLHTKFLKDSNHKLNLSGALNACHWKFLPKGIDDFRDGLAPSSDSTYIPSTKPHLPVLKNASAGVPPQKPSKKITKEQACFSKLLPMQQARREYIAGIEYGLTQHPLALYPHLEEGLPPEVFEEIVDILDPEMRLKSASGSYEGIPDDLSEENITPHTEQQEMPSVKSRQASTRLSTVSGQSRVKNPYTWLHKQEEAITDEKKFKMTRASSPAQDESVKKVTKEFCDWVNALAGEPCSITESTIFSLFASCFDPRPAVSVPVHVVELSNVPAELRMSVGLSTRQCSAKIPRSRNVQKEPYYPSWVKTRYGAWYLDPKTWKKQKVNEPLTDPAVENIMSGLDLKMRLSEKDLELFHLHATNAFKDFLEKNSYRKPEFINKIFPKNDDVPLDGPIPTERRTMSSARNTWYRSGSASTHEESIIN